MTLNDAANIATIAEFLLSALIALSGGALLFGYIKKMRPVWKRFTSNIEREIAVISSDDQLMEHEAELLRKVGYFKKITSVAPDARNLDLLDSAALLVVGYTPNSRIYKEALAYAKSRGVPIIVYSGKHRLTNDDRDKLKDYTYSSLCETDLRLVSDVFAVMSTIPGRLR
ncbi:MAG TPA: hypothetical protein VLG16_03335 [Candidatus Saccharimonadales bacterium]|nr:hypothetical protein [Candidatus Saccharimonadales bacterium]